MRWLAFVITGLVLTHPTSIFAENYDWVLKETVDSMTDQTRKTVRINSKAGHQLAFWKHPRGEVWVAFILPDHHGEIFGSRYPQVRIDKRKMIDLEDMKGLPKYERMAVVSQGIRGASWRFWTKDGNKEDLSDMLMGEKIRIRYFLFPEENSREISFPLPNSKELVWKMMGWE